MMSLVPGNQQFTRGHPIQGGLPIGKLYPHETVMNVLQWDQQSLVKHGAPPQLGLQHTDMTVHLISGSDWSRSRDAVNTCLSQLMRGKCAHKLKHM